MQQEEEEKRKHDEMRQKALEAAEQRRLEVHPL